MAIIAANLLTCLAEVIAMRKMTFMEKWEREHVVRCSKGGGPVRAETTKLSFLGGGERGLSTGRKLFSTFQCAFQEVGGGGMSKYHAPIHRWTRTGLRGRPDVFSSRR